MTLKPDICTQDIWTPPVLASCPLAGSVALAVCLSVQRWGNESHLFGRSLSSRPRVSLSFSHSHPETDASQSLRPEHNNSSHARALHIQMLLYAFNYSYCRWALCLTTPGLAALLTHPAFWVSSFWQPFVFISSEIVWPLPVPWSWNFSTQKG